MVQIFFWKVYFRPLYENLSEQIYLFQILCYFVMLLIVCKRAGVNYNQD